MLAIPKSSKNFIKIWKNVFLFFVILVLPHIFHFEAWGQQAPLINFTVSVRNDQITPQSLNGALVSDAHVCIGTETWLGDSQGNIVFSGRETAFGKGVTNAQGTISFNGVPAWTTVNGRQLRTIVVSVVKPGVGFGATWFDGTRYTAGNPIEVQMLTGSNISGPIPPTCGRDPVPGGNPPPPPAVSNIPPPSGLQGHGVNTRKIHYSWNYDNLSPVTHAPVPTDGFNVYFSYCRREVLNPRNCDSFVPNISRFKDPTYVQQIRDMNNNPRTIPYWQKLTNEFSPNPDDKLDANARQVDIDADQGPNAPWHDFADSVLVITMTAYKLGPNNTVEESSPSRPLRLDMAKAIRSVTFIGTADITIGNYPQNQGPQPTVVSGFPEPVHGQQTRTVQARAKAYYDNGDHIFERYPALDHNHPYPYHSDPFIHPGIKSLVAADRFGEVGTPANIIVQADFQIGRANYTVVAHLNYDGRTLSPVVYFGGLEPRFDDYVNTQIWQVANPITIALAPGSTVRLPTPQQPLGSISAELSATLIDMVANVPPAPPEGPIVPDLNGPATVVTFQNDITIRFNNLTLQQE